MSEYTGIFIRDFMAQQPGGTGDDWTHSPDIIPTDVKLNPNTYKYLFIEYNQDLGRNAAYQVPNNVYIRGLAENNFNSKVRIYLYYVEPDQMHLPANWKSDNIQQIDPITGVPAAQNWAEVTPGSLGGMDGAAYAIFSWTPPAISGTQVPYRLIAWVANDDQPFNPTSLVKDLGDDTKLQQFVEAHPNMSCRETTPTGVFVRDYVGQTPYVTGSGWTGSPDVIPYGPTPIADLSSLTPNYGSAPTKQDIALNMWNYVYVRGKNLTNGAQNSRVYLFYVQSDKMNWPENWESDHIMYKGQVQNWADVTLNALGDIFVTGFQWRPPAFGSDQNSYRLIAYVDNHPSTTHPFDPTKIGYLGDSTQIGNYVYGHTCMAVSDTTEVAETLPTVEGVAKFTVPGTTGTTDMLIGLRFENMSTDGQIAFIVPGLDANNTIITTKANLTDPDEVLLVPATYPFGFETTITYRFWKGSTQPSGAKIHAIAYQVETDGTLKPVTVTEIPN